MSQLTNVPPIPPIPPACPYFSMVTHSDCEKCEGLSPMPYFHTCTPDLDIHNGYDCLCVAHCARETKPLIVSVAIRFWQKEEKRRADACEACQYQFVDDSFRDADVLKAIQAWEEWEKAE